MTELANRMKQLNVDCGEYELMSGIIETNRFASLLYQLKLINKRDYDTIYNKLQKALDNAEVLR